MKVLSLTQPWATLMAHDEKRFETRSWSTPYRGPLAIHASSGASMTFPAVDHWLTTETQTGDPDVEDRDGDEADADEEAQRNERFNEGE